MAEIRAVIAVIAAIVCGMILTAVTSWHIGVIVLVSIIVGIIVCLLDKVLMGIVHVLDEITW